MKIVVSATGTSIDAAVDERFGRARCFVVLDDETMGTEVVENTQNMQAAQGAGIQAARTVIEAGAEAVITGNVGPKAHRTLAAAGVKAYLCAGGTVAEALEKFKAGELEATEGANVEGHWV